MARSATARIKLNPPLGRMPTLQFLRPGEIRVDPAYQRSVEAAASITLIRFGRERFCGRSGVGLVPAVRQAPQSAAGGVVLEQVLQAEGGGVSQNRSSAVMQQRSEPHDSLDDFPTPPWATRALCEWLIGRGEELGAFVCREPAANRGHMVKPLAEYFQRVEAGDVHDYGAGFAVADYLWGPPPEPVHYTITNPPFRLAEQFIERATESTEFGFAMLARSAFLEGVGRYERLFSKNAPSHVLQFTERVVIHKGRLAPEGSTATAYAWLVWLPGGETEDGETVFGWIPPCRKRLERAGDYA